MNFPNFSQDQYIDADSMNAGFAAVSGSIASNISVSYYPGLVSPDAATLAVSGLTINSTLTSPFGVLFATGVMAKAHGTANGADTQNYSTSFSSLVPSGSGSVVAYLLASYAQIEQTPIAIIGPPPGHPDFNPNFVPYTAYQNNVDSLALSASSGAADNATTFELARFTLVSGMAVLPAPDTSGQRRFATILNLQTAVASTSGALSNSRNLIVSGGSLYSLPPLQSVQGETFTFSSTTRGFSIIAVASGDTHRIYGAQPSSAYPAPGVFLLQGMFCTLLATPDRWQVIAGSPFVSNYKQLLTGPLTIYVATTGSDSLNTGLSSSSPFATIQHAWDFLQTNYDIGTQSVVIQVAAGTYTAGLDAQGPIAGILTVQSVNVSGVAGASIAVSGNPCFQAAYGAAYALTGFTMSNAGGVGSNSIAVAGVLGGEIFLNGGHSFGVCGDEHILASTSGIVYLGGGYTINGGAPSHFYAFDSGTVYIPGAGVAITLTGTPNFTSSFAACNKNGTLDVGGITFTGGASGQRWSVSTGGGINTSLGSGATGYFPGTGAGVTTSPGWYS